MLLTRSNSGRQQAVEDFVTIEESERLTGYTGQYLRRMARQGRIRAIKFGGFWMVHLADAAFAMLLPGLEQARVWVVTGLPVSYYRDAHQLVEHLLGEQNTTSCSTGGA